MALAYVDTSFLLADAFGQRPAKSRGPKLADFDTIIAARFLEAEFYSAFRRESLSPDTAFLDPITWIDVNRSLALELETVLKAGYVRGADSWHLATALFALPVPHDATFLTFDLQQRAVAKALGFRV